MMIFACLSSVEIRPENEYDKLIRLSNESLEEISNDSRPCGGFSLHYDCACDFYQIQCYRSVQNVSTISGEELHLGRIHSSLSIWYLLIEFLENLHSENWNR